MSRPVLPKLREPRVARSQPQVPALPCKALRGSGPPSRSLAALQTSDTQPFPAPETSFFRILLAIGLCLINAVSWGACPVFPNPRGPRSMSAYDPGTCFSEPRSQPATLSLTRLLVSGHSARSCREVWFRLSVCARHPEQRSGTHC